MPAGTLTAGAPRPASLIPYNPNTDKRKTGHRTGAESDPRRAQMSGDNLTTRISQSG